MCAYSIFVSVTFFVCVHIFIYIYIYIYSVCVQGGVVDDSGVCVNKSAPFTKLCVQVCVCVCVCVCVFMGVYV